MRYPCVDFPGKTLTICAMIANQMAPGELREALIALGINQVELARKLDTHPTTVRRWVAEDGQVPGPVAILVNLLLFRPELRDMIGFADYIRGGARGS
jgi:DNA-binding transcriptional regulator YiaG